MAEQILEGKVALVTGAGDSIGAGEANFLEAVIAFSQKRPPKFGARAKINPGD